MTKIRFQCFGNKIKHPTLASLNRSQSSTESMHGLFDFTEGLEIAGYTQKYMYIYFTFKLFISEENKRQ